MILQQFNATKNHQLCKKFLHITDFFHISHVESIFHITSCHVENFSTWKSVMWRNFSTWQKNSPQARPVVPVTNIRYAQNIFTCRSYSSWGWSTKQSWTAPWVTSDHTFLVMVDHINFDDDDDDDFDEWDQERWLWNKGEGNSDRSRDLDVGHTCRHLSKVFYNHIFCPNDSPSLLIPPGRRRHCRWHPGQSPHLGRPASLSHL